MLGLLSCHFSFTSEDLFVVACDMPLMETVLLKELFNLYKNPPCADAYVFTNDGEREPLCGI